MFMNRGRASVAHLALRWAARVLSIASTAVLFLFLVGEPFDVSRITAKEWIGFAFFPIGIVIGFAVAWWREGLGGAITTASLLVFCLVYLNSISKGWAFFVFAFPGLLFLLSGLLSRWSKPAALHT